MWHLERRQALSGDETQNGNFLALGHEPKQEDISYIDKIRLSVAFFSTMTGNSSGVPYLDYGFFGRVGGLPEEGKSARRKKHTQKLNQ